MVLRLFSRVWKSASVSSALLCLVFEPSLYAPVHGELLTIINLPHYITVIQDGGALAEKTIMSSWKEDKDKI